MKILLATTAFLFLSCQQETKKHDPGTTTEGNKSTTISTDTSQLSKIVNIQRFRPTGVKFKYVLIDNSGKGERVTVPGPSDSYLEAVLYFDSTTFNELRTSYFSVDYPSPGYRKEQFNFDWLDTALKNELMQSDTAYHGHPDIFIGKGKLWFLHNKVLLHQSTD